jgi:TatD DNase family protein
MNLDKRIRYIDFHSHHSTGTSDTVAVVNIMAGDDIPGNFHANTLFSTGIHPWFLTADNITFLKAALILNVAHPHVMIIGEAGFDSLRGPQQDVQYSVFRFQAEIAEEMHKPVVIHCIKGWDALRRARKEIDPVMPWVIHGFRGKRNLAVSLAEEGYWFSLGTEGLKTDILEVISGDRILLETDESSVTIGSVYRRLAELGHYDKDFVSDLIRDNFNRLFKATE